MIRSVHSMSQGDEVSKVEAQKKRLHKACQEFESIMTNYLLKSMRESVMKAEEPDQGRETYEGMFDETLAGEMSKSGGQGLSELLYQQLVPLVQSGASSSDEG
ncbi:MAG: rod-binding protein [Syntrophobacteraceae bacterium]